MSRLAAIAALSAALLTPSALLAQTPAPSASVADVAKEGYVYGFPIVDLYRIMFGYFIDAKLATFKAPLNKLYNTAQVYTPADTTVQTPNSDTPYSFVGLDLRAEPIVLTLPAIGKGRYYSAQLVDQYTYNIGYLGSRATGNGGGKFLLAGPNWRGTTPAGIVKVINFDTQFGVAIIRTQLLGSADLPNVKKIQAGYAVEPLSAFEHRAAPPAAQAVSWIAPLPPDQERTSPAFFNVLAFVLQFCPVVPGDVALRDRLAHIGVIAGNPFDPGAASGGVVAGMAAGQKEIDAKRAATKSSADLFGTRASMNNNYLDRALGAQAGILGNTAAEALYAQYQTDAAGKALSGNNRYTLHFAKGAFPPVHAFWSLTMYDLPQQLMVKNPIDRYLINSPMLPALKHDADGGVTLYIQHASPAKDRQPNWLPTPAGPFFMVMRLYWPEESALNGQWKQPPLNVAD